MDSKTINATLSNQNRQNAKNSKKRQFKDPPKRYYKLHKSVEIYRLRARYGYELGNTQSSVLKGEMQKFNIHTQKKYTKKGRFNKLGRMDKIKINQQNPFHRKCNPIALALKKAADIIKKNGLLQAFKRIQKQAQEHKFIFDN